MDDPLLTPESCGVLTVVFVALALAWIFVAVLDTITHWRDRR